MILNQNKKGGAYHGRNLRRREHEILFMDLRTWTENPVKGEGKKKVCLCLIKNGYPPQYSPEVFRKVMEQVENFEENNT